MDPSENCRTTTDECASRGASASGRRLIGRNLISLLLAGGMFVFMLVRFGLPFVRMNVASGESLAGAVFVEMFHAGALLLLLGLSFHWIACLHVSFKGGPGRKLPRVLWTAALIAAVLGGILFGIGGVSTAVAHWP